MNHEPAFHDIPPTIRGKLLRPNSAEVESSITSGLSASKVHRCRSPQGWLCLRGWPKDGFPLDRLERIRESIESARAAGIRFLPAYLKDVTGSSFVQHRGCYWELTEWMPGQANYLESPSAEKRRSAMQALAAVHNIWKTSGVRTCSPAMSRRIGLLEKWQRTKDLQDRLRDISPNDGAFHTFMQDSLATLVPRTIGALSVHGPLLSDLLEAYVQEPVQTHFVLRDVWSDHVLFTGDEVTGVIDFGAAAVDEPATDLARLLGSIESQSAEHWIEAAEIYQALQPDIDLSRTIVLDYVSCLLSAAQWMQWLVFESRVFSADPVTLMRRWESFLDRIERFPWREILHRFAD